MVLELEVSTTERAKSFAAKVDALRGSSNRNRQGGASVVALVPAHNEQARIEDTIRSLFAQTHPPSEVIIISDNSTDNTVAIARSLQGEFPNLRVMETVGNTAKKAGALNQGFELIGGEIFNTEVDFVLQMDADTVLDEDVIANAIEKFGEAKHQGELLGGVCSRCRPLPYPAGTGFIGRMLWRTQNIEYCKADAQRLQSQGNVHVLAGAVSIYTYAILWYIYSRNLKRNRKGEVWPETSLVEDYALTLDLKDMGWKVDFDWEMFSWTDVPLTVKSFLSQRIRWYGGTAQEVMKRKFFTPHVRGVTAGMFLIALVAFIYIAMGTIWTTTLLTGGSLHFQWYFIVLGVVSWLLIQRDFLFFVRRRDIWQFLMMATVIPYILIELARAGILFYAWTQALTGRLKDW